MHSRAEGRGLYGAWRGVCTVELRAGAVWCKDDLQLTSIELSYRAFGQGHALHWVRVSSRSQFGWWRLGRLTRSTSGRVACVGERKTD